MNGTFYRGEIYYVNPGNGEVGSEIRSGRPGVIVSNDLNNRHSAFVEIVYLTTKDKKPLPTHVHVESSGVSATALCEQVVTVDKSRLSTYICTLTSAEMKDVEKSIVISLGLDDYVAASKESALDPTRQCCSHSENLKLRFHSDSEYIAACAQRDAYKELCMKLIDRK